MALDALTDPVRLQHLRATCLLDTARDETFDAITRLAAAALGASGALVTLVDADRQWFKSSYGLAEPWAGRRQTPLSHSFCQHVVALDAPLAIEDAREHPLVRESLAIPDLGVIAYLGAPLRDRDGQVIGSMSVLERHARRWDARELALLTDFAGLTMIEVERRRAEAALRESEARNQLIARATNDVIWDWDLTVGRLAWNDAVHATFRYPPGAVATDIRWWYDRLHPEDRDRVVTRVHALVAGTETGWTDEYRFRRGDGSYATVLDRGYVLRGPDGRGVRLIGSMLDLTERLELEARLRQAQKLEAVGQLAGGIAHDFNNLLTVIQANLEFVAGDLPPGHAALADLAEVSAATDRTRTLVRQLLAVGRKQVLAVRRLDVNAAVREAERLLRRALGDEIAVHVEPSAGPLVIEADPGQLEQVLLNLAINARDAMLTPRHGHPGLGGALTIEADAVTLTADDAAGWDPLAPGRYVRLTVRDTGHGMDAETASHAFEPFFTTKPLGEGTGLGLATVHGIVAQSGGAIRVTSVPGAGTAVVVLLPHATGEAATAAPGASGDAGAAAGTVLLVEDEGAVRAAARRLLERRGYTVREARHGADALLTWREHREAITAVVTDIRMPELGGRELIATLHAEAPDLPVVYVSGYAHHERKAALRPNEAFVEKPFTGEALLGALARVLGLAR